MPVSTRQKPLKAGLFRTAAPSDPRVAIDKCDRLNVVHERPLCQAAALDVFRERAPERQVLRARLLLADAPNLPARLQPLRRLNDRGPRRARFHLEQAAFGIEAADAVERAQVEQRPMVSKLLPAHRVPAATDGELSVPLDRPLKLLNLLRPHDLRHSGWVES